MNRFASAILLSIAVFVSVATAQNIDQPPESFKIDEFGKVADCEFGARVDALFIALGNNKEWNGLVIIYSGSLGAPALTDGSLFGFMKSRFDRAIAMRKYDAGRVKIIDGGFREVNGPWSEIFLVPPGASEPIPTETVPKPSVDFSNSLLIGTGFVSIEAALIKKPEPLVEIAEPDESETDPSDSETDESDLVQSDEFPEDQPTDDELDDEEYFEEVELKPGEFGWVRLWADLLIKNADAHGTVIFYADNSEYDIGLAKSLIEEWIRTSSKERGVDPKRIDVVYGGYREFVDVDLWFIPKGGKPAVPKPEVKRIATDQEPSGN